MELGESMITLNWESVKRKPVICKVCGKEDVRNDIRKHIESGHIVGALHPCAICGKTSRSRGGLKTHIWSMHHWKSYLVS